MTFLARKFNRKTVNIMVTNQLLSSLNLKITYTLFSNGGSPLQNYIFRPKNNKFQEMMSDDKLFP